MIRDTYVTFATAKAATTSAGTTNGFGDVVDLQGLGPTTNVGTNLGKLRDVGDGQDLRVVATVDTSFDGSAVLSTYNVITSANANMSSPTVIVTGPTYGPTDTVAGSVVLNVALPTEGVAYKRYLGIQEVIAGAPTAGKISIGLQLDDFTKPTKTYAQGDVGL